MSTRFGGDCAAISHALDLGGSALVLHLMGCSCPGGASGFTVGLLAALADHPPAAA